MDILSFDAASQIDEAAEELEVKKIEKRDQIESSIKDLRVKIARAKAAVKKSIVNPRVDTVEMLIDIDLLEKQLKYSKEVLNAIFPEDVTE